MSGTTTHSTKAVTHALALAAVLVAALPVGGGADDETSGNAPAPVRRVVVGEQYRASGGYRWLWGGDYRKLWTAPMQVEVLNLQTFAGGLTPVMRVGGQETKGLALRGADGRDYTFRGIDKDPTTVLPEELRDTWARDIVKDQIAANHPASFFVVDELMRAAGIPTTDQRLVVMPDDPSLGEFRKDFAGLVGQLYEFPQAHSARNPGFRGAVELLKHEEFYRRIATDPAERVDTRAFLKARLFDVMIGDWDRHRDQWRWARFAEGGPWVPIPDDRDQAFSRYDGLVLALSRPRLPILQTYSRHYPSMKGLTWNGWEQDRQILAGLERPVWEEVARELKSQITDEVIARAARRMPPEYFAIDGARLIHDLTGRRDRLAQAADAFYEHIADKVQVHLTDASEYVEVQRRAAGDTLVQAWKRGGDGNPSGDPFYHRTLHAKETSEVQIYTGGGEDRVVTMGRPGPIAVRVIGGAGHVVVDDTKGGGTELSDSSRGEVQAGHGTRLDRRAYTPPPPPKDAPWIPARDWGRDTFLIPWLSYAPDAGAIVGVGIDTRSFAFRKDPFGSRHVIRGAWASGESTYRADYLAEFRVENRRWYWGWYGYASGIESLRFFGFGNETSDGGNSKSDFFKAKQKQYAFTPTLSVPLFRSLTLHVGPTVKYASSTHKDDTTLINNVQPYGYGDFGEVGGSAVLELDTRQSVTKTPGGVALREIGYPRSGALVTVRGLVYPKAWDVKDTFGSVKGSAAAYLTPGSDKAPTLALRVGGEKVFGNYPYFEAAYLGGGAERIGGIGFEDPLRGLYRQRYVGDASLSGSADLRIYVSRFRLVLPGTWGLLGFGDVGRVYLKGEDSNKWHKGYGGGLWFAWLDRTNTVTATYGRSEGNNAFYVRAGFAF